MRSSRRVLFTTVLFVLVSGTLLPILLGLGCGKDHPPRPVPSGTVNGQITELMSGAPVTDASVILIDPATIAVQAGPASTNAQGMYQLENVDPGTYTPVVFHDSLAIFDRSCGVLLVTAGETTTCHMRLQDTELFSGGGYRITGVVKDANTGKAVPRAYVESIYWAANDVPLFTYGFGLQVCVVTDSEGRFTVDPVIATSEEGEELGLFPITVSREGYLPFTLVGRAGDCGFGIPPLLPPPPAGEKDLVVEINLRPVPSGGPSLAETGAVRGRVTFLGSPVAGIKVLPSLDYVADPDTLPLALSVTTPMPGAVTTSNAQGEFLLADLIPGRYLVHAGYEPGDGYVGTSESAAAIEIVAGDTLDVGDVEVLLAMEAMTPADGSTISDTTPLLSWRAVPDTLGYHVVDYELQVAVDSYVFEWSEHVQGTSWEIPAGGTLAPGAHVKWQVAARALATGSTDPVPIAQAERFFTFSVEP